MEKFKINESALRSIVKKTIKSMLNENKLLKEANEMLNESMIAPSSISKIYKSEDGGEASYIVIGDNGRFYEVYPSYNDSYLVDSDCDEYLNGLCKKITQAFRNHGIPGEAHVYNWDGEGEVIVEPNNRYNRNIPGGENFTPELVEKLKVWMKNKGFTFKSYDDMYESYHFIYDNYTDDISPERQQQLLDGYTDCTDIVEKRARMQGIYSTLQLFKDLDRLSAESTEFSL